MTDYVNKLTRGQRSVLRGLDERFVALGCGEPTAKDLCAPNTRRPALVKRKRTDDGGWLFALTPEGMKARGLIV